MTISYARRWTAVIIFINYLATIYPCTGWNDPQRSCLNSWWSVIGTLGRMNGYVLAGERVFLGWAGGYKDKNVISCFLYAFWSRCELSAAAVATYFCALNPLWSTLILWKQMPIWSFSLKSYLSNGVLSRQKKSNR